MGRFCQVNDEMNEKIENALKLYDLILLAESENSSSGGGLMGKLLNAQEFRKSDKKILIRPLEKYRDWLSLYYTYEFSDRFRVIERSRQYGGLFNYVDNGLLTEAEVFALILR